MKLELPFSSHSPAGASKAAFSLIEVLCAILILGVAMAGLTRGITTALSSTKESEVKPPRR
jgi:prepilin-type N-terminal cleavage/methylation domain-containing protein